MDTDLNLAIALKKKAIMAKNFCGNDLSLPTDGLALLLHLDVRQSFVFFVFFWHGIISVIPGLCFLESRPSTTTPRGGNELVTGPRRRDGIDSGRIPRPVPTVNPPKDGHTHTRKKKRRKKTT